MNTVDDIVLCAMNDRDSMETLKDTAALNAAGNSYGGEAAEGFTLVASIIAARVRPHAIVLDVLRAAVKLAETCDAAWLAENTGEE